MFLTPTRYTAHLLVASVTITLAIVLVPRGLPCPRVDDAFYKSPAAELVQRGRLAIPCCVGFIPRAETVFACYPPVYQGLLAPWYWWFGVSVHTSLAYSFAVHLLGAVAVTEVAYRALRIEGHDPPRVKVWLAAIAGLVYAANLAYFDRQEETALLWLWAELLWLGNTARLSTRQALLSGWLVGMAGMTSPFVGLLGAVMVAARTIAFHLKMAFPSPYDGSPKPSASAAQRAEVWTNWMLALAQLSISGIAAGSLISVWYLAMESLYPGIILDQFFWLMAHLKQTQNLGTLGNRIALTRNTLLFNPPQLPAIMLLLVGFPLCWIRAGWRCVAPAITASFLAGLTGLLLVVLIRPTAYTYLGATLMLLLPCLAPALGTMLCQRQVESNATGRRWALAAAIVLCCLVPAYRQAMGMIASGYRPATDGQVDRVVARLQSIVPAGQRVAVTARHWHAFQGRNPWREAYFSSVRSPSEVLDCHWLVLDGQTGYPSFIDRFELVEQLPPQVDPSYSYAYSVWKRKPTARE